MFYMIEKGLFLGQRLCQDIDCAKKFLVTCPLRQTTSNEEFLCFVYTNLMKWDCYQVKIDMRAMHCYFKQGFF